MAPVAYGMLALVGGAIVVAVLVGAAAGAINGRFRGELSLGALLAVGTYLLLVTSLESWSAWRLILFAAFPLILTFLVGSLATQFLETRFHLRPVFASLAGLGSALLVGFLYLTLTSLGGWPLADPDTAWIAVVVLSYLIILSIQKRMRTRKDAEPRGEERRLVALMTRSARSRAQQLLDLAIPFLGVGAGAVTVVLFHSPMALIPRPPYWPWLSVVAALVALALVLAMTLEEGWEEDEEVDPAERWKAAVIAYVAGVVASITFAVSVAVIDRLDAAV